MTPKTDINSLKLHIEAAKIADEIRDIDVNTFVLKNTLKLPQPLLSFVANQLVFNKAIKLKMPSWQNEAGILAPPGVSLQQSSSEITALFKTDLFSSENILDLCGGFGIDAYGYSKKIKIVTHNEPNVLLSEIVKYNFERLGVNNVLFTQKLGEEFPFSSDFENIYVDPSRRNDQNQKLFKIQDCLPDLTKMPKIFWETPNKIVVKYSPILEIKEAIKLLPGITEVIILAEKNEVKELLLIFDKKIEKEISVRTINFLDKSNYQELSFNLNDEIQIQEANYSVPLKYLFEPNSAIMKAGAFKLIAKRFNLYKISKNSHLYTSDTLIEDFPGRVFEIKEIQRFDKKQLKNRFSNSFVNVVSRNFPYSTNEIKKILNFNDGGTETIYFTQDLNSKKIALICQKYQN